MKISVCFLLCLSIERKLADDTASERADESFIFSWNAYRGLKVESGSNVLFSPNRVRSGLSMLLMGSTGTTNQEILKILDENAKENLTTMYERLHDEKVKVTSETEMEYEIAARFFVADTVYTKINPDFKTQLRKYFDTKLVSAPFAKHPDSIRKTIDDFVAENTLGQIPQFLAIDLPKETKVVLVNAIFLEGQWTTAFNVSDTAKSVFHAQSGDVQADFMELPKGTTLPYAECDNKACQLVILPYTRDKGYIMVIVLPTDGTSYETWENAVDPEKLRGIWANATNQRVHLKVPKFTVDNHFSLKGMLANMGATHIFGAAGAENSEIFTENVGVFVDDFIAEAKIIVSEKGVTPAKAIKLTGDEDIKSLELSRTFLFFIVDASNDFILYWGRIADPTKPH